MSAAAENIDYKALYEQLLPMLQLQQQNNGQLLQNNQELLQSNKELRDQVTQLQYQLYQLTKLLGGFKTEKFVPSSLQQQQELGLSFEQGYKATNLADVQKISYVKQKQAPRENGLANAFADHLRVEETVIEPSEDVSGCEKVGEEVKEQLGWKPGEIFIQRTITPQYKCAVAEQPDQHRIVQAHFPGQSLPKSIATPELLAQIIIDKFIDHKPLNRQLDCFKRSNVTIAYSTITDWVRQVANVVVPLGHLHLHEMYQYDYWHGDETTIQVLDSNKKKDTHQGYYWTYLTHNGQLIYFDYHRGRDTLAAKHILQHFRGHLQVDGYDVYEELDIKGIHVFFCMAHARRHFYEAKDNDKVRAEYALTEIAKLYKIEEQCREEQLNPDQIKVRRTEQSVPVLKELGEWMKQEYVKLKPKSPIAQAIAYSIKRWDGLSLYASTNHLHIDNNPIERCMKNLAVGRKNYLFCGSHEAAKRAGLLYSLLVTCKLNNVNPYQWLREVLSHNINEMTTGQLRKLLPHQWKKAEAITTA